MKETSLKTYRAIQANGTLSKLRLKVFEFICLNPGGTMLEASEAMGDSKSISGRFGELEEMGFIEIVGEKKIGKHNHGCYKITGRTEPRELTQTELIEKINRLKEKGYRYLNEASKLEKEIFQNVRG